jgi:hypothetical protein
MSEALFHAGVAIMLIDVLCVLQPSQTLQFRPALDLCNLASKMTVVADA